MSDGIRVLIADDHPMFREGLNLILAGASEIRVIAESGTAAETFRIAREHRPDVIILDISLPDVNGLSALPQILEVSPDTRILVLSMHADSTHVARAFELGAHGYIAKQSASRMLVQGIRDVFGGGSFVDEVTRGIIGATPGLYEPAGDPPSTSPSAPPSAPEHSGGLTATEQTVLRLLVCNHDLDGIAEQLGQTEARVGAWRNRIFDKLGVSTQQELEAYARENGVLDAKAPGGRR